MSASENRLRKQVFRRETQKQTFRENVCFWKSASEACFSARNREADISRKCLLLKIGFGSRFFGAKTAKQTFRENVCFRKSASEAGSIQPRTKYSLTNAKCPVATPPTSDTINIDTAENKPASVASVFCKSLLLFLFASASCFLFLLLLALLLLFLLLLLLFQCLLQSRGQSLLLNASLKKNVCFCFLQIPASKWQIPASVFFNVCFKAEVNVCF